MLEELKVNSPFCQALTDLFDNFNINAISWQERDALYKSYTNDYLYNISLVDDEDDKNIEDLLDDTKKMFLKESEEHGIDVYPVKYTIERITNGDISALKPEQFKTVTNNGIDSIQVSDIPEFWIQPVFSYIPDVHMNLRILDEQMEAYGYVRVRHKRVQDSHKHSWWILIYNPDPRGMEDIRKFLRKFRMFHFSPEFNRDSILENGLLPSKGGRTYTYPDARVFFYTPPYYLKPWQDPFSFPKRFKQMMQSIARKTKTKHSDWSGYFDVFELDTSEVPANAKTYWDPNMEHCIYLNIHIEPEWIKLLEDETMTFG